MAEALKILVIGAGIGGLTAALALKKAGFNVQVYEREANLKPLGAGIVVWPNGVKTLNALGLRDPLKSIGAKFEKLIFKSSEGEFLNEIPVGDFEKISGAPVYPVCRADLQSVLLAGLGSNQLRLGAKCIKVSQSPTCATAHFEDGHTESADLIVGADGIHSAVRHQLLGEVVPRYSGVGSWVGIIEKREDILPEGSGLEYVGECKRCGLLPLSKNRIYVGFSAHVQKGSITSEAEALAVLHEKFHNWDEPVLKALAELKKSHIKFLEIHDINPLDCWGRGRLTLLGDAAHATTPTMGQGACQAMEDAVVLVRCLESTSLGVEDAIRRYEQMRLERTTEITIASRIRAESLYLREPQTYSQVFKNIKAWSVTDTMKILETIIQKGPF